jgi:thermitase
MRSHAKQQTAGPVRLGLALMVLATVLSLAPATAAGAPRLERAAQRDFVPGEAIVRFEGGTVAAERLAARQAADVTLDRGLELSRAQLVEVADGSVAAAVRRLERQPGVAYAQPNYRYHSLAVSPPDDPLFGSLWGLEDSSLPNPGVGALDAWQTTRGAGQVIAVVDTGIALDHPDLVGNLWTGPGGIHGHDFVDDDSDPDDYDFHGTHVAGTAAAIDDNGIGVAGVAPDAQLMAVRVLDGNGSGSSADIGDGIAFAAQNGADVINLSLGTTADSDAFMSNGIAVADQLDAVVVAAAGNDGKDNEGEATVPCNLPNPNIVCVAAVNQAGALAGFSNYGAAAVDVGAPGTNVLSAETDYAEILAEDFATNADWSTGVSNGGLPWGLVASPSSDGNPAAADSPFGDYGQAIDEEDYAVSTLVKSTPLSLVGRRGCRMHFRLRYEFEDGFDGLIAGAAPPDLELDPWITGSSDGVFSGEEISISDMDGSPSAAPRFTVISDFDVQDDGAYLDQLRVLCRTTPSASGDYVAFQGTSMAAPHVAGVAALVGAADPSAPDTEIVEAIKAGGAPLGALAGKTVTGRVANAAGAIGAALQLPTAPPQPPVPPSTPTAIPTGPAKPDLSGARRTIRVSKRRSFAYSFRATPGLSGEVTFRTRRKAVVARRAHLTIGTRAFSVGSGGRVTVRVKLSRRELRILRRNGALRLRVTAVVRDAAGLSARATARLTLKPPRR